MANKLTEKADPVDALIGAHCKRYRNEAGLSRSRVGMQLTDRVSSQMIEKYELGISRTPPRALVEMAYMFGVPVAQLFEGVEKVIYGGKLPPTLAHVFDAKDVELLRDYNRLPDSKMKAAIRHVVKVMATGVASNLTEKVNG